MIESEIDEALLGERLRQTQNAGQVEKQLGKSRVALLAVDRQKAEMQLAEANRTLEALEVRAPHDGMFVIQRWGWTQRVLQAGDRAFPGMRIAEVATSDRMDAEIAVLEADAGGLEPGKRALLVLDARPDMTWKGKVKKVDPFPKPKHPEVPAQYFGAILSHGGRHQQAETRAAAAGHARSWTSCPRPWWCPGRRCSTRTRAASSTGAGAGGAAS